ncbi:hypothetical protein HMPREF0578_1735 [Mobiluncus mulieris 28-1]|nr:hypothetical protein HMPREF0578_1735 [Mobiluncus mulieris 28-1]
MPGRLFRPPDKNSTIGSTKNKGAMSSFRWNFNPFPLLCNEKSKQNNPNNPAAAL